MKMKTLMMSVFLGVALSASAQTHEDFVRMQSSMNSMQQTISDLQKEVTDLKQREATNPAPVVQTGKGVEFTVPTIQNGEGESQIIPHESLRDYQEAAQRPSKIALDPKYKGFIPIPNTPAFIKFNAKVKLDMT